MRVTDIRLYLRYLYCMYIYIYILIKIFVSMKLTRGAGREVSNSVAFQTDARTSVSHLAIRHIQCFYIYIYMMP